MTEPLLDSTVAERSFVFISYSRHDAAWAQRVGVLLKPLLRRKQLRLWIDSDLRAGDSWRSEIMDVIAQSRVALLLVSADFLASDFIMEHEVPALRSRQVLLTPVLIGDCLWQHEPALASVQWLHDPRRDGALNLARGGRRDRKLREICDRLLEVAPVGDVSVGLRHDEPVATTGIAVAAEIPGTAERGELSRIPDLPLGYVVRDDLDALIGTLISTNNGAVGLTGDVPALGLHGQGGIGKSVLATALARDNGIGHRFPDGIYWVVVGERPDILANQLDLLARLGARDARPRTVIDAKLELTQALKRRRVLLVVDDVWSQDPVDAFRVTGPQGRVLYTSRDPGMFAATGIKLHQVEVLSVAAARELAAGVVGAQGKHLPEAADRIFEQVGRVPLAVALLAAAVRGGRSWRAIEQELERNVDVFAEHPYANTFKAMQIAVGEMSNDRVDALLSLAVFPADTRIPIGAVARYWAYRRRRSAAETHAELRMLGAANLLQLDEATIGFHDLQRDYLLLHAPLLSQLHESLLAAYASLLPTSAAPDWARLPKDEPYIWDHLVEHLRAAGRSSVLVDTVSDPAYLARRIGRKGAHGAESDISVASEVLPGNATIEWWRTWIARHAHLFAGEPAPSMEQDPEATAISTMFAWLRADSSSRQIGIDPATLTRLLPAKHLHVRWGLTIAPSALIRVLSGHSGGVRALTWSPDGSRVASGGEDGLIRLWDPSGGKELAAFGGHRGGVRALAWSPDGLRVASGGEDGLIRLWDPSGGKELAAFGGHRGGVRALAWSPDGSHFATAGKDESVIVWDAGSRQLSAVLSGQAHGVQDVTWSPDGNRLATVSNDWSIRLWNPRTGRHLRRLTGQNRRWPWATAWSPDGRWLAVASQDAEVRLWDVSRGSLLVTMIGHVGAVRSVAWSPDGARIATAGEDWSVRVWDATTGSLLRTLIGHTSDVRAVVWSPDGNRLASASNDWSVRLWDSRSHPDRRAGVGARGRTTHIGWMRAVKWSPNGRLLATGGDDYVVRLWDPSTGHKLDEFVGHTGRIRAVTWSPDGSHLASAGSDSSVHVWRIDLARHRRPVILTGHADQVMVVAWRPDGACLATGGEDGTIRLWSRSGRQIASFVAHVHGVRSITWAPDCSYLASAGDEEIIRIWDPLAKRQVQMLGGHARRVICVSWSPDGSKLASVGDDESVRVWEPSTGQHLSALTEGMGRAQAVVWSPDSARIATASDNGVVNVCEPTVSGGLIQIRLEPLSDLSWMGDALAVAGSNGVAVIDVHV